MVQSKAVIYNLHASHRWKRTMDLLLDSVVLVKSYSKYDNWDPFSFGWQNKS